MCCEWNSWHCSRDYSEVLNYHLNYFWMFIWFFLLMTLYWRGSQSISALYKLYKYMNTLILREDLEVPSWLYCTVPEIYCECVSPFPTCFNVCVFSVAWFVGVIQLVFGFLWGTCSLCRCKFGASVGGSSETSCVTIFISPLQMPNFQQKIKKYTEK